MGLILDSSVLVAAERQGQNARQMLSVVASKITETDIGISVVTSIELAHGVARANTDERRAGPQQFLDELLIGCRFITSRCHWRFVRDGLMARTRPKAFECRSLTC